MNMEEALQDYSEAWAHCIMKEKGKYTVYIGIQLKTRDDSHEKRLELIHGMLADFVERGYVCSRIACGLMYEQIGELHFSQQEAQLIMKDSRSGNPERKGEVLFFDELAIVAKRIPHITSELLEALKDSLENYDKGTARRLLKQLMAIPKDVAGELLIYVQYKIVQMLIEFIYNSGNTVGNMDNFLNLIGTDGSTFETEIWEIVNPFFSCAKKNTVDEAQVVTYIQENFTNSDLSLSLVADHFQMAERSISRITKKNTGKNFKAYIDSLRLTYACDLLENTDLDIQDIIKKVGYYDKSSFIRLFKLNYGKLPSEYREETKL